MKDWVTLLIVTILFSFTTAGFSQTNDEGLAFLQLNFLNPGARPLAMGGAFIGMADDATAALANPAGLTILIKPEISLEFASTDYTNEIPWAAGRQFSDVQVVSGQFNFVNYSREYLTQDFSQRVNGLSFASFVYPVVKSRFVLAGFYNEQTKFRREFETDGFDGFPACVRGLQPCNFGDPVSNGLFFATNNSLELTMRNFGLSAGFQPGDNLSFGVTLSHSSLDMSSTTLRIDTFDIVPGTEDRLNQEALDGDDSAFSYSLGALINPGGVVSLGAVYTNRPEFDVTSTYTVFRPTENAVNVTDQFLKAPDSFGFGVTVRPSDAFSINLDINRILYSQLNDGYYNAFFNPDLSTALINNDALFSRETLEIEDTTDVRFGGEYVFTIGSHPFAVRAGYWRENFHSLVNRSDDANLVAIFDTNFNSVNEVDVAPWFSRSLIQDFNHFTFGTGFVFQRFSIDWAYDHSDNFSRFVLSSVFYLGR